MTVNGPQGDLGLPPEIAALVQRAMTGEMAGSLDMNTYGSVWASSLDDDYPVQSRTVMRKAGAAKHTYLPGGASPEAAREFLAAVNVQVPTTIKETAKELLADFTARSRDDPDGFNDLQQKLFLAGFYDRSVKMEDIPFGSLDDTSLDAWYRLLQYTARYNEAGQDVTWDEILDERASQLLGPLREKQAQDRARGARTISLADPAGLALALDQVAQNVLGRKATADEQRMYVAAFHSMQSGAQSVEVGTAINPDVQGQAEAMLRQNAPVEARGHDIANTFNNFLSILGGIGKRG